MLILKYIKDQKNISGKGLSNYLIKSENQKLNKYIQNILSLFPFYVESINVHMPKIGSIIM